MPVRARIATVWATRTIGLSSGNWPKVDLDHRAQSWLDVTEQPAVNIPAAPALVIIEGVWSDTEFAALSADPTYAGAILWSDNA